MDTKVVHKKDVFAGVGNAGKDFVNSDEEKCATKRGDLWDPVGLNLRGREVINNSNLRCAIA